MKTSRPVPLTSFFYFRIEEDNLKTNRFDEHPIACVALCKHPTKFGAYRMSYYIHKAKNGPFVKAYARMAAVGRLNSENKSTEIASSSQIMAELHYVVSRRGGYGILFAVNRNEQSLRGALLELEPRGSAVSQA